MVKSNKKSKKLPKKNTTSVPKRKTPKSKPTKNVKKVTKTIKTKKKQKNNKNKKHQARLKLSKMVVAAQIEDGDQWESWLDKNIYKKPENYQLWLDGEMENDSVVSLPDFLEEYENNYDFQNDDDEDF